MTKTGVTTIDDNGDVTLVVVFRFYRLEFLCLTAAHSLVCILQRKAKPKRFWSTAMAIVSFSIFTWLGKTKKNMKKDIC